MSVVDVHITKINETWMKVECREQWIELDITDKFSFQIKNPQFDPRVKRGHWDGIKKLYNRKYKKLYVGLLLELMTFLSSKGITYKVDENLLPSPESLNLDDLKHLCEEVIQPVDEKGELLVPYDYQYTALLNMINMGRSVSLAATSAGKSLIIYLLCRIYQLTEELSKKKIVIVVPTINLLEQLYSDFQIYSAKSNWFVGSNCQKISGSYAKTYEKHIIITTWQSTMRLGFDSYEDVGSVIVDECHGASAKQLTNFVENCRYAPFRHGLTGTLDDVECNEMVIQGLFGPVKKVVSAKQLIDSNRATAVKIKMVVIHHNEATQKALEAAISKKKGLALYQAEVDFINALEPRRGLLEGMINSVNGNTVILFDRVEKYGEQLYNTMAEKDQTKNFLFTGSVEKDEKELIRQSMETHDNSNIFASFQTFQMGVSIKKLHNAFLISSSKSKIRILQSLGRLMRKHDSKESGVIYDVVDDIPIKGKNNLTFLHAFERIGHYKKEGHPIEFIELNL